jgi:thioredoxin 2
VAFSGGAGRIELERAAVLTEGFGRWPELPTDQGRSKMVPGGPIGSAGVRPKTEVAVSTKVVRCEVCGRKNRVPDRAPGVPRCAQCKSPLPWIVDAGDGTFAEVAEQSKIPVLVDLWAPWCGPCRVISPALEALAREFAGRVKLVKVNVDESPDISRSFSVQGIPTLLLMNQGEVVARQVGAAPEGALRSWLDAGLARSSA